MEILSYRSNNIMGNWDQADPNSLAPEQEQNSQHSMLGSDSDQQQTVLPDNPEQLRETAPEIQQQQQQQQKQAPSTTPGWQNEAIAVKQEPVDDGNNDSGISPGHYTSDSGTPPIRQSPTMATNVNVLPVNNISPVPNVATGFPYSPQSISPPIDFQLALDYAHARFSQISSFPIHDSVTSMEALGFELPAELEFASAPLVCPVCTYSSRRRISFCEHIKSHSKFAIEQCKPYEFNRVLLKQLLNGSNIDDLDGEPPKPEDFTVEACKVDNSKVNGRKANDRKVNDTKVNDPKVNDPKVNDPKADDPKADDPKADDPKADDPKADDPKAEDAKADDPKADDTKGDDAKPEDVNLDKSKAEFRLPRMNAQNRIKSYRCKQCPFIAITKVDFWHHSSQHIKPVKLLNCPLCPFVTEYKHHLDYHLKNHSRSKPYKCEKCSYTCVNKSMLNSHLKSHSNVYQFSCADCSYATKYCHSLKQHLRKYNHTPAMVLNTDGTPNPLIIIDVYGTRRGPKAKPKKDNQAPATVATTSNPVPMVVPMQQKQQQQQQHQQQLQQRNQLQQQQQQAIPAPQFQFNPMNGFQGFNGFPYSMFPGFQMNPFNVNRASALGGEGLTREQLQDATMKYLELTNQLLPPDACSMPADDFINSQLVKDVAASYGFAQNEPVAIKHENFDTTESSNALDLSKNDSSANDLSINMAQAPAAVPAQVPAAAAPAVAVPAKSPETSRSSRRKGRAFKVDRNYLGYNDDEMPQKVRRATPTEKSEPSPPPTSAVSTPAGESSSEFACQYCDISFGNEVMHSVHMGYHGYQNPFTCNMCGVQCNDKVSFFLHIARVKH